MMNDSGLVLVQRRLARLLPHAVLILFVLAAGTPFVWMVMGSFKSFREITTSSSLLPQTWILDNYVQIVGRVHFAKAFSNSAIVAGISTLSVMITSSMVGYVFATYRFPGKDLIFILLLTTLMVPFAVVLVPLYIFMVQIGAADQLSGLILPALWSTFGIFLMRQFMEGLPSELIDASRIDGASEWQIFGRIVLPLSLAPLAALGVVNFLVRWDDFLWPSIVLTSPEQQTIPVLLAGLRGLYWSRYDLWMAGAMLTVVPVFVAYVVASKQFIRGIAMTGLKG